jgi:hypothetical protein
MLAMQYSIQLPENYDADAIRTRVEARKQLFDDHDGLVHKSFLYNDTDKVYAPFYIWKEVGDARQFLLDDLFKGVVQAFTRHRVRSWVVMHMVYGNRDLNPTHAQREVDIIPAEEPLDTYLQRDKTMQDEMAKDPNLYMHVVALDADRWEVLHFSLWKDKATAARPTSDSFLTYEVLHVSEPKA